MPISSRLGGSGRHTCIWLVRLSPHGVATRTFDVPHPCRHADWRASIPEIEALSLVTPKRSLRLSPSFTHVTWHSLLWTSRKNKDLPARFYSLIGISHVQAPCRNYCCKFSYSRALPRCLLVFCINATYHWPSICWHLMQFQLSAMTFSISVNSLLLLH